MTVFPNQTVPALTLPTISGGTFNLHGTIMKNNSKVTSSSDTAKHNYALLVFYRGIHCPICVGQLKLIEAYDSNLLKTNMSIVAISIDTKEKVIAMKNVIVNKSNAEQAKKWGLYMSAGRPDTAKPTVFWSQVCLWFTAARICSLR